jgi:mannose-6-phosphate isomerase-like protein (cupin superfamily)
MKEARLDPEALLGSAPLRFGGSRVGDEEVFQVQFLVNDPRGVIAHEAFLPDSVVNWAFWHDEVHVVTRGRADVTYTLGPNHRKQVRRVFETGDTYLIPSGARVKFEIGPEPYVHVCVIMPRFEYTSDERHDKYE